METDNVQRQWYRTAWGRLKFELTELAFAGTGGFTPEDYTNYLWSTGVVKWMGKAIPTTKEYLLKEAETSRTLYPEVTFELGSLANKKTALTFTRGCFGGAANAVG